MMLPILAGVAGGLVMLGIVIVVWASTTPPPPRRTAAPARPKLIKRLSRRQQLLLAAGAVAGVIIAAVTGFVLAIIVVPAACLAIPWLLSAGDGKATIRKLEAMEEWSRQLAAVLRGGQGLDQAILATVRSAPEPIGPQVRALASRLRSRISTDAALAAFGEDLADPTGDMIVCTLRLGAHRSGSGLSTILHSLADSVASDVTDRRAIEASREGPRAEARVVTLGILVMLAALFASGYLAPLTQPVGEVIVLVVFSAMAGLLVWLRKLSSPIRPPRLAGVDSPTDFLSGAKTTKAEEKKS